MKNNTQGRSTTGSIILILVLLAIIYLAYSIAIKMGYVKTVLHPALEQPTPQSEVEIQSQ